VKRRFTINELYKMRLPGLPNSIGMLVKLASDQNWKRSPFAFNRSGRGGGIEYDVDILPEITQHEIQKETKSHIDRDRIQQIDHHALWASFGEQSNVRKEEAKRRLHCLQRVHALVKDGIGRTEAFELASHEAGASVSAIRSWETLTQGVHRSDWLAALVPQARGGKRVKGAVDGRFWDAFRADYLRLSEPSFEACYRRTVTIAAEQGWAIPAARTLRRRVDDIAQAEIVLKRQGIDALKRMVPAMERTRDHYHALQAVNTDGHKWDVFVKWEDGTIGRPLTVAFQDLYSGKFVAWRTARSENKDSVRSAFGDMISRYGIPDHCFMDNGRSFASKWLTGGTPNRYRFKVRADEPHGIMTQMGVQIHWTTPYAGQSKPIERGFRDFANDIARHPAFEGAYTGNSPMAKPANYGDTAVPIAEFIAVIDREIAAHNARVGRRSAVCGGTLSFDSAFAESYGKSLIRRATEEQRRLCLLAAESVLVKPLDGTIHLFGNRYWDEALWEWRGERVVVRFDPDHLKEPLLVSKLDGTPICSAAARETAGFDDTAAARTHNQARATIMRTVKERAKAEAILSLAELAALQPKSPDDDALPAPAAVRPFRPAVRGNLALAEDFEPEHTAKIMDFDERLRRGLARRRAEEDGL
jgi:putative transposase